MSRPREKFFEIVDAGLIKQVKAWQENRHQVADTFLRLSRRVGASRTRYASSDGMGTRSFAFIFTREPDRKHWKRDRSGQYWIPKVSSKIGKAVANEVADIRSKDGSREELSALFGIENFWHNVGIETIGNRWFVVFGDEWKFSQRGLRRISDVQIETLRESA